MRAFFTQHRSLMLAIALVGVVSAAIVFFSIKLAERSFYLSLEQEADVLEKSFNGLLERTYKNMEMMATFVGSDTEVQQLFYRGKLAVESEGGGPGGENAAVIRDALYASVSSSWKQIHQKFDARQLHFHLAPGSLSFLRVHRPEKFGDRMDDLRHTVVDVNAHLQPVKGFETGRVYSGLRGVVPVFARDSKTDKEIHVGALEVGTSFKTVLDIFDRTQNVGAGVLLSKDHVRETMWPDYINKRFDSLEQGCDCYLEAESRSGELKKMIFQSSQDHGVMNGHDHKAMLYPLNGGFYGFTLVPLFDYKGSFSANDPKSQVGYIAFWYDRTQAYQELLDSKKHYLFFGLAGFVFVSLVMIFLLRIYTRHLVREVKDKTQALQESTDLLQTAQQIAHLGHWQLKIPEEQLIFSDEVYRILGLEKGLNVDLDLFITSVHSDDRELVMEAFHKAKKGISCNLTHKVSTPTGQVLHVRNRIQARRNDSGLVDRVLGTVQDISHQVELQTAIEAKERLYRQVFERNRAVKLLFNPETGEIIDANDAAQRYYGYSHEALTRMNIDQITTVNLETFRMELGRIQDENRDYGSFRHRLANGDIRDVEIYTSEVEYQGQSLHHSIVFDVTERNQLMQQLQQAAMQDSLTGLYNRRSVDYRAEPEIARFQRSGQYFSVMMLDIDHFKRFNDTYGHDVGDLVLKAVAELIKSQVRGSDLVGRFGGEEFIVLAPDTDSRQMYALAERIISAVRAYRIEASNQQLKVTLSAGIATLGESFNPEQVTDLKECFYRLVKKADEQLYNAKNNGRDRVCA